MGGGGTGGRNPEIKGLGSLQEVGEKRVGSGKEKWVNFHNIMEYVAIEKAQRGGNHQERNWEYSVPSPLTPVSELEQLLLGIKFQKIMCVFP